MLAKEWVLRERLRKEDDQLKKILPLDSMRLILHPDYTYQLIRRNSTPNGIHGVETIEWGTWELEAARGLIKVRVTNVDGQATLNAMLYRWQIEKLTPRQLILNQFGFGEQYLVLEQSEERL
jgi:hypothetical protein